jgi:putative membrane protein
VLGRRRGWIAAIAFTALQAVALGGLVPIETAPDPVQGLNGLLPVSRAADGFGLVGLGGQVGSPVVDAVVLLLWGAAALVASTLAARRRQQVTLDDVRRSVAAVR